MEQILTYTVPQSFCGSRAEKNAEVCPNCGRPYGEEKYNGVNQIGAGGIGYSAHADDAAA